MSEFGFAFLLLGLAAAVFSALAYLIGGKTDNETMATVGRRGLYAAFGFISASVVILLVALLTHDYSIAYVADYSSNETKLGYLISALWAGNSGSLLFWAWVTALVSSIVVARRRTANRELVPYAGAVMMGTLAFFLILVVATANPFVKLATVPADGQGLNPLLENPGMVIHPPLLLAGYVCFVVPFAFGIAALAKRKLGTLWLSAARNWAVIAWMFLGLGNLIGAWWAYVELGWGGYWAWDPVENAGLMPWLVATAFLHSVIMQRRKGMFKMWSMVLVVTTFVLVIFGTFLTRSGFLSSVHTYDFPSIGPYFIGFLAIVIIGSIYLLVTRRQELRSEGEVEQLVSREGTFLLANILLVGSAIVIFFGTMYPTFTDLFTGNKVEVGTSFFDAVAGPLFLAIILLIGFCTLISWRSMTARKLLFKLRWPAVAAVVVTVIMGLAWGFNWYSVIGMLVASLALASSISQWLFDSRDISRATDISLASGLKRSATRNRVRYGAFIVHFAIAVIAIGVIGSSLFHVQKQVSLTPGTSTNFAGYTFSFGQLSQQTEIDRQIVMADVNVTRDGKTVAVMHPEQIKKTAFNQWVVEVAIRSTPVKDIYVILGGWDQNGTAQFTFKIIPAVIWIWIGGGIFLAGSLLVLWPSGAAGPGPVSSTARTAAREEPVPVAGKTGEDLDDEIEKQVAARRSRQGRTRADLDDEIEKQVAARRSRQGRTRADLDDEIEKQVAARRAGRGRFCPQCGKPTEPTDKFCAECGTNLRSDK